MEKPTKNKEETIILTEYDLVLLSALVDGQLKKVEAFKHTLNENEAMNFMQMIEIGNKLRAVLPKKHKLQISKELPN